MVMDIGLVWITSLQNCCGLWERNYSRPWTNGLWQVRRKNCGKTTPNVGEISPNVYFIFFGEEFSVFLWEFPVRHSVWIGNPKVASTGASLFFKYWFHHLLQPFVIFDKNKFHDQIAILI